jgi:hypothetical protein
LSEMIHEPKINLGSKLLQFPSHLHLSRWRRGKKPRGIMGISEIINSMTIYF